MDGGTDYSLIGHPKRVELLAALRRQRAELDARETRLLAAMAADPVPGIDGDPALDKEWVREDVACALRIPPETAGGRLHTATELATRLPATLTLRLCELGQDVDEFGDGAAAAGVERHLFTHVHARLRAP